MLDAPLRPQLHLFVCANARGEGDPLGAGCSTGGDAVYDAMKQLVAERGAHRAIWVTRTQCLGVCPKEGCTVAIYPKQRVVSGVQAADARALFERALTDAGMTS